MSGGFECDGDGRYELVRDGIAVLCNTTTLAVDAGNPNPPIFHLPSSIFHSVNILVCFRTTQIPQPANRSFPFPPPPPSPRRTSLHLSHPSPSICLFSFCPPRPSSRRCACICVDLVVGGWGFVSGFVQFGGGMSAMRWERRGDGNGGGG